MESTEQILFLGLGYIGLPTAAVAASKGLQVIGVDIDRRSWIPSTGARFTLSNRDCREVVREVVRAGRFRAATKPVASGVYLIVVPTPFKGNHEPDVSYVEAATRSVVPLLKAGDLFIIESTSPVGTTDRMARLIFSERPELEGQLHVAYCPERVLPGNVLHRVGASTTGDRRDRRGFDAAGDSFLRPFRGGRAASDQCPDGRDV